MSVQLAVFMENHPGKLEAIFEMVKRRCFNWSKQWRVMAICRQSRT